MGKTTGFMEVDRQDRSSKLAADRIQHFKEFTIPFTEQEAGKQGSRCMDCGVPFCHQACPIHNLIPDWNDLIYKQDWQKAAEILHRTNNFPEWTGRICPAPCETACTLDLEDQAVTIKSIECSVVDKAWEAGWILPQVPRQRTGFAIAIVGSGPAGLACAQQLARVGHRVTVFEKQDRIGGLLRYGIPDFKMSKRLINRRISQMQSEGVTFRPNTHVGTNLAHTKLLKDFDAIVLACGSEKPRDLNILGRNLKGVHFAMDFLTQQNRRVAGDNIPEEAAILATDKDVIVIGGGDTGSDCVGTSIRQGALSVTQIEILPKPPSKENKGLSWPHWPHKLFTSSSQEEGCERKWALLAKKINEKNSTAKSLECAELVWQNENGKATMAEVPNSKITIKADLILLAMGFESPIHEGWLESLNLAMNKNGTIQANDTDYKTTHEKVFCTGDMRRGQSLVVWAIREGRQTARSVDQFLQGQSSLPR